MVPQYKPEAALAFLASWIAGEDYSPYNASCAAPAQRASGLGSIGAIEAEIRGGYDRNCGYN